MRGFRHETCMRSVRQPVVPSHSECAHTVHGETEQKFRMEKKNYECIMNSRVIPKVTGFYLDVSELLMESLGKVWTVLHCRNLVGLKKKSLINLVIYLSQHTLGVLLNSYWCILISFPHVSAPPLVGCEESK